MKTLLPALVAAVLLVLLPGLLQAQSYTTGRLTVNVQNYISRDSTDCSGAAQYQYQCTVAGASVTDTVKIYLSSGVTQKYVNTQGANPFTFLALTDVSTPFNDFTLQMQYLQGDTAVFYFNPSTVVCGTDTVLTAAVVARRYWPNPCQYDTLKGRMFVDLDSDCLGAYVNAPAVNIFPIVADTVYGGVVKTTAYNQQGNGFYTYYIQRSFRSGCCIYLPDVLQFLYPNSNCLIQSYSFQTLPHDTVIYPFHPSPMVDVVCNAAVTNAVRPLTPFIVHPVVYNMGYNPVSGQLSLVLNQHVSYNQALSSNPPAQVNGDTLTWNFTNLNATSNNGYWNSFFSSLYLTPDSSLAVGDSICFTVFTGTINNDINTSNNYYTFCLHLVGSYDPNLKEVTPAGEGPTGLIPAATPDLTYTVHFQNTGTASAIHIFVIDTLDANIDPASLQILKSSHNMQPQWLSPNIVKFKFAYINLPDSASNEPKSHGSFSYKINLKPGLAAATQIKNTAAIYFDTNAPVLTNTAVNTIETSTTTGIAAQTAGLATFTLAPNPAVNTVIISIDEQLTKAAGNITDLAGRIITTIPPGSTRLVVNTELYGTGVYFVHIGGVTKKLVINK